MMGGGVSFSTGALPRGTIAFENFFGLRENPFSLTPNPRFLHRTRQAHETLGRLTRGILDRKGLILLSGEIGTGKTTLLYTALHLMDVNPAVQNKIGTAVIVHPTLTRDEFLEAVLDEFDVACPSTRRQRRLEALLKMLLDVRRKNGVAVLVIDEAHLLSAELLEEIRSLLSLQTSHEKLLQIVLCGQPELDGKIDAMNLNLRHGQPFVEVRCNTAPLSLKDAYDYIQHRLRIAGAHSDAIFEPEAVAAVHVHTNGIPRLVNLLCAQALSVAGFYQAARVSRQMIDEAAARIGSGALASSGLSARARSSSPTPALLLRPELAQASPGLSDAAPAEPAQMEQPELAHANFAEASLPFSTAARTSSTQPSSPPALSNEVASTHAGYSVQAARKKRRAERRRAKMAQAAKRAQAPVQRIIKCKFSQNPLPSVAELRPSFRASPFRRGKAGLSQPRRSDARRFERASIRRIAASVPAWNQWLNRWCGEHFTSKSCGKPLFQLGLAGTLFLALAQIIGAGFAHQHVAHVVFGFTGMLFIDISLGLGTYLLFLERGLSPANRAAWARTVLGSWGALRRRLG
jgi:general secretion pathway protein A